MLSYLVGVGIVIVILIYEHTIVKPHDLSRGKSRFLHAKWHGEFSAHGTICCGYGMVALHKDPLAANQVETGSIVPIWNFHRRRQNYGHQL